VYGEKTLLSEFKLDKGSAVPLHRHAQEQTGFLVSGRILLVMAGDRHELEPGDSWAIPGGVEHGAEALEDSLLVEVFSPLREDYIP
jgi:quercetin dioxygenase-like cupin family protein